MARTADIRIKIYENGVEIGEFNELDFTGSVTVTPIGDNQAEINIGGTNIAMQNVVATESDPDEVEVLLSQVDNAPITSVIAVTVNGQVIDTNRWSISIDISLGWILNITNAYESDSIQVQYTY